MCLLHILLNQKKGFYLLLSNFYYIIEIVIIVDKRYMQNYKVLTFKFGQEGFYGY